MVALKRRPVLFFPITLAVTLLSALAGCGGDSDDLANASNGTPRKTPSEILKEAQAKNAGLDLPKPAATKNVRPSAKARK